MNDWDHENSKVRKDQDEWESANGNDRPNEHEDNERKGAWEADKNDGSARDNVDKRRGEWDGDFVSDENNEWDEPRENEWERDEDENWRDDEVERDNENRMDQNKTNRNGSRYKDNANDDDGNEEDEEDWYDEYEKDRARLDGDDSGGKGPAARVKRCCATCYTPSCEFRGPW